MTAFEIGGARCEPGLFARGKIIGGYRDDGSAITIPLLVLNGRNPGPVLWLGSTTQGIEIVGAEIIRRVIREAVNPERLSGTVVGAPIQNPEAYLASSYLTPRDGQNVNRFFPGRQDGSMSERLAYALYSQGVSRADMVVDIHANTAPAVPFVIVRGGEDDLAKRARALAECYGLTILEKLAKPAGPGEKFLAGLLPDAAMADGKPGITVEYEAWTLDERWVQAGVTGTLNVLKRFNMIPGEPEPIQGVTPIAEPLAVQVALRANFGGLAHHLAPPGSRVSPGTPVLRIIDPLGEERELLRSPVEGYVMCYPRYHNQTAASGDEVAYIAPFRSA